MNVTLTGAAGRIGAAICRHLAEVGHTVKAVDQTYRNDLPIRPTVLNLLNPEAAYTACDGADCVVHLANHPRYTGGGDAQRVFNENVAVNMNVFQACAEMGVRRIVFASSVQVFAHSYGIRRPGPDVPAYLPLDGHLPPNPGNPYALSKVCSESMLRYFTSEYAGLCGIAVRFPGIHLPGWTPWTYRGADGGASAVAEGFAFLHVTDAAALVAALVAADLPPGYRCYFPAARQPSCGRDVQELLRAHYAHTPLRKPADQMDSLVDLSELEREIGWQPAVNRPQ